jgi:hypothetical protein
VGNAGRNCQEPEAVNDMTSMGDIRRELAFQDERELIDIVYMPWRLVGRRVDHVDGHGTVGGAILAPDDALPAEARKAGGCEQFVTLTGTSEAGLGSGARLRRIPFVRYDELLARPWRRQDDLEDDEIVASFVPLPMWQIPWDEDREARSRGANVAGELDVQLPLEDVEELVGWMGVPPAATRTRRLPHACDQDVLRVPEHLAVELVSGERRAVYVTDVLHPTGLYK